MRKIKIDTDSLFPLAKTSIMPHGRDMSNTKNPMTLEVQLIITMDKALQARAVAQIKADRLMAGLQPLAQKNPMTQLIITMDKALQARAVAQIKADRLMAGLQPLAQK